jgi:hypothetical protein
VREQPTEAQLTGFDLLTRSGPDLSAEERGQVKLVARTLLEKVQEAVALQWRQKVQATAQVQLAIEDALDEGLPADHSGVHLPRHWPFTPRSE